MAQDSAPDQPVDNYQQALTERLVDEGRALLMQGEFASAERTLLDALQLVKINNGMNSPLQLPVLDLLIQAQLPQQQWETIQQYLAYFDWLNDELYKTNLNDFLSGTEVLGSLHLQAAADPNNPRAAHYLVSAKNHYWHAVSAIEGRYGKQSSLLTPWLYRIVLSHFYQSSLVKRRGLTSYNYKTDEPAIVNGWSLSKNESIQKSYNIGLELLERIKNSETARADQNAEAIAWLYLGDWETAFGNGAKALQHYLKANQVFIAAGATQQSIDLLFAQTTIVPEPSYASKLSDLIQSNAEPDIPIEFIAWSTSFPGIAAPTGTPHSTGQEAIRAQVSFDYNLDEITELMGAKEIDRSLFTKSNLTLVSISSPSEDAVTTALRDVSLLNLRPRLISGELVQNQHITIDYLLPSQSALRLLTDN